MVVLVGGVPTIEGTCFEFVAVEMTGVGSSKSSKPHASSAVSVTEDTINELGPLDVRRIGCWLIEGLIGSEEPNKSSGFIEAEKERAVGCRTPFATGGCWLENKKSENSSSSSNRLVFFLMGFCDGGGNTGMEVTRGGDTVLAEVWFWGVVGRKGDDGGGGMRKGTAPEDDVDGVDDIRTIGNDGIWGRRGFGRFFWVLVWGAVLGGRKVPLCEAEEEGREGV
jgi:hypothetical protein